MAPPPKGDPGPLEKLPDFPKAADAAVKKARAWPAGKLDAVKKYAQDRLAALYSPKIAAEIRRERSRRCLMVADRADVEKAIANVKQQALDNSGAVLTDAQAREKLIEQRHFDHLIPHEHLNILEQRGLAGPPLILDRANTGSWSPDPNKAVAEAIPDKPGVYVFAVARANLNDSSMLFETISVERKSDGTTSVLSGSTFQDPRSDVKRALDAPIMDENPSRSGSRAVLLYPLNPTAEIKK